MCLTHGRPLAVSSRPAVGSVPSENARLSLCVFGCCCGCPHRDVILSTRTCYAEDCGRFDGSNDNGLTLNGGVLGRPCACFPFDKFWKIISDHFGGPGSAVGPVCVPVCVSNSNLWTKWSVTCMDIWHAGSSWRSLSLVQRSRAWTTRSQEEKVLWKWSMRPRSRACRLNERNLQRRQCVNNIGTFPPLPLNPARRYRYTHSTRNLDEHWTLYLFWPNFISL